MQDSLSQGTFLSVPEGFSLSKAKRLKLFDEEKLKHKKWEESFNENWKTIETEFKKKHEEMHRDIQEAQLKCYRDIFSNNTAYDLIRCDLLLTGSNVPDRSLIFENLKKGLTKELTKYVAVLWSRDCSNLKLALQQFVKQIIPITTHAAKVYESDNEEEDKMVIVESNEEMQPEYSISLAKYQMSLNTLHKWYKGLDLSSNPSKTPIVLIIADFESFELVVLNSLIELLGVYKSSIPFLLLFGVASTPTVVYQTLMPNICAILNFKEIHYQPSVCFLNTVIDEILLSEKCPFRLNGKVMSFLIDNFLFNSFSIQPFMVGFKYCMLEHFYEKDHFALCCSSETLSKVTSELSHDELEQIRRIRSFQTFVENCELSDRKLLLLDDEHTKKFILEKMNYLQSYLSDFYLVLKCLKILTNDLPGAPFGRYIREIYCQAATHSIIDSEEYKKSLRLIEMQSRADLENKIKEIIDLLKIDSIVDILEKGTNQFDGVIEDFEGILTSFNKHDQDKEHTEEAWNDLKKSVIKMFDEKLIKSFLKPLTSLTFYEIILFEDIGSLKRRINGISRGSVHTALADPQHYLDCDCCKLEESDNIVPSLPDVSIAYKLHLECGKTILLGDWLQSFAAVIQPDKTEIGNEIQARFNRAVSELQFLGFIKPSKGKTDRVSRQTFVSF